MNINTNRHGSPHYAISRTAVVTVTRQTAIMKHEKINSKKTGKLTTVTERQFSMIT
jgi:hypothetical protein